MEFLFRVQLVVTFLAKFYSWEVKVGNARNWVRGWRLRPWVHNSCNLGKKESEACIHLISVTRRLVGVIHRINHFKLDKYYQNLLNYPLYGDYMDFAVHPSKNWGLYGISLTSFAKFYPCWSEMNVNRFRAVDRNLIACSAVWHLCSFLIENRPDPLENITTEENLCIPSFHVK